MRGGTHRGGSARHQHHSCPTALGGAGQGLAGGAPLGSGQAEGTALGSGSDCPRVRDQPSSALRGKTVPGEDQERFRHILGAGRSALQPLGHPRLTEPVLLSPAGAPSMDIAGEGKERDPIQRWKTSSEHRKC